MPGRVCLGGPVVEDLVGASCSTVAAQPEDVGLFWLGPGAPYRGLARLRTKRKKDH
jgi:hypothetical protein